MFKPCKSFYLPKYSHLENKRTLEFSVITFYWAWWNRSRNGHWLSTASTSIHRQQTELFYLKMSTVDIKADCTFYKSMSTPALFSVDCILHFSSRPFYSVWLSIRLSNQIVGQKTNWTKNNKTVTNMIGGRKMTPKVAISFDISAVRIRIRIRMIYFSS